MNKFIKIAFVVALSNCLFVNAEESAVAFEPTPGIWENNDVDCSAPKITPVACFVEKTVYALKLCTARVRGALLLYQLNKNQEGDDKYSCIKDVSGARPYYDKARLQLEKNPASVSMLKDVAAYWTTGMSQLAPELDERKITYQVRVKAINDKYEEMANRLLFE